MDNELKIMYVVSVGKNLPFLLFVELTSLKKSSDHLHSAGTVLSLLLMINVSAVFYMIRDY